GRHSGGANEILEVVQILHHAFHAQLPLFFLRSPRRPRKLTQPARRVTMSPVAVNAGTARDDHCAIERRGSVRCAAGASASMRSNSCLIASVFDCLAEAIARWKRAQRWRVDSFLRLSRERSYFSDMRVRRKLVTR